uniref:Uncharacterized protein n=1 Tax=Grammatophora oceanica TaxID=210454 RepID=A0A6U5HUZ6_9STRA
MEEGGPHLPEFSSTDRDHLSLLSFRRVSSTKFLCRTKKAFGVDRQIPPSSSRHIHHIHLTMLFCNLKAVDRRLDIFSSRTTNQSVDGACLSLLLFYGTDDDFRCRHQHIFVRQTCLSLSLSRYFHYFE